MNATDRGVSTVVGFVLTLGISSLLIVGLLVATGGFVSDQRQATVQDEMEVLGQQVAADLEAADRLVNVGGDTSGGAVTIRRPLPDEITGITYRLTVDPTPPGDATTLRFVTRDPDVTVEVTVRTETAIAPPAGTTTLTGGDLRITYDSANDRLEVAND